MTTRTRTIDRLPADDSASHNPLAEELSASRKPAPCALVIFGASGDLTRRKLVPSLMGLARDGLLPDGFAVLGFARSKRTDESFREGLRKSIDEFAGHEEVTAFDELEQRFLYHQAPYDDLQSYKDLAKRLAQIDKDFGTKGNRLFYLATPPSAYSGILKMLADSGLSKQDNGAFSRVIIEKPFGHDLGTAQALNAQVNKAFRERQVYRIDHYLGKETVQNILALRFANGIFEPLWNEKYIDHVQITVAESLGVEDRGSYFEEAGVLRDMIQNHLLQVMTMVAMEPPVELSADGVRDEKVKVLRAVESLTPDQVLRNTVRGQYAAGSTGGEDVVGYRDEDDVASDSNTETFTAVRLRIDNWRWAGTPFLLRSGKRLPRRVTEVAIQFKRPPHTLFGPNAKIGPNVLLLRIQPDEGVSLRFGSKVPGPDLRVRDVRMDFRYGSAFGDESADAYERLLLDAMLGDSTLFARRDEVEEAWRIVDSIQRGWLQHSMTPEFYKAGSWGPKSAQRMLGSNRTWRKP